MKDLDEMPAGLTFLANALKLGLCFSQSRPQRLNLVRVS